MRRVVILTVLLVSLGCGRAHASQICAINVSTNFATAMADGRVTCGVFYVQWDVVEPTKGVFDWSTVDAEIALIPAGKKYWLDFWGADHTPPWVYTDGAVAFPFIWPFATFVGGTPGFAQCSTVNTPIPWDAVYATDWKAFLAAAATKYGSDPKLAGIKLNTFGSFTQELVLPLFTSATPLKNSLGQTVCFSNNDAANWTAAGYTTTLIENAFNDIAASYVTDFPNVPLAMQVLPIGFPFETNIENGGGPVKDLAPMERLLIADCFKNVPRCETQNDGWTALQRVRGVQSYQEGGLAGNQLAIFYVSLIGSLNFVPKRFELFDADIVNPANSSILNVMLVKQPQRYGAGQW